MMCPKAAVVSKRKGYKSLKYGEAEESYVKDPAGEKPEGNVAVRIQRPKPKKQTRRQSLIGDEPTSSTRRKLQKIELVATVRLP